MIIVDASGSGECHLAQVRRDFRREPARPWHSHQPTWLHELSKLESSAQGQHGVLWTRGKVANSAREVQCCPFRVLACPSADSFLNAVFTVPSGIGSLSIVSLGAPRSDAFGRQDINPEESTLSSGGMTFFGCWSTEEGPTSALAPFSMRSSQGSEGWSWLQ